MQIEYLRVAEQNVEFAKTAKLTSLANEYASFEKLDLSILTAAQLEDSYKPKAKPSEVFYGKGIGGINRSRPRN